MPASISTDAPRFLRTGARPWLVLSMLSALYVFSLIDRQIFVLLIGPIKAQFQLSDVQIGLLIGTAFAAVYSFMGIPAGRIADRGNRKQLIVAGAIIWCLSTIASGFATSYAMLVMLRLGLAAGEAVLTPAAHSMIGDLFPREKRSLAASLYTSAGLIGAPLAFSGGALVISGIEGVKAGGVQIEMQVWQLVLFVVGLPSLALAILFWLVVREPQRTSETGQAQALAKGDIMRQIASRKKLYAGLFLSSVLAAGCSYALNYWTIESLKRDFGWSAVEAGSAFGPVIFLASVVGVMGAPWLTTRVKAGGRADAVILVSFAFVAMAFLSLAIGPILSDPVLRLALIGLGLVGTLGGSMNIVISMQEVAPARMRATFVALLYMGITLFGAGAVPVVVPVVGGMLSQSNGLSGGLAIVCTCLSGIGLLLLWWIRADFEREAIAGFPVFGAHDG
ncbi:MFS transporter [Rhizorhapis suberifaciens]|uniref:MFS family permease n=1 Tax=Rhizorhapis suberifaciens TaxID=13656 RepID=A0A840HXA8_9SPHN|nr:MFS transporter [Rhizorhapis suberifaciens]MBB4642199.1 MFS family permease [Rhizorhapis suberifaciens]